jgi:hypothetical protein
MSTSESIGAPYWRAGHAVAAAVHAAFDGSGLEIRADIGRDAIGVVAHFATRSVRNYEAVLLLSEGGYGVEAQSIVRMMLEDLVTLRYIASGPASLATDWVEHEGRRRYQYIVSRLAEDPDFDLPQDMTDLEAQHARDLETARSARKMGRVTSSSLEKDVARMGWTPLSLVLRARRADESGKYEHTEHGYHQFYPYLCEHVHGSSASARDYMADVNGMIHVVPDRGEYKCLSPLVLATWYLHWIHRVLGDMGLAQPLDVMSIAATHADFDHGVTDLER